MSWTLFWQIFALAPWVFIWLGVCIKAGLPDRAPTEVEEIERIFRGGK